MRKTGAIWNEPDEVRDQIVRQVCVALEATYQQPRLGNPEAPLDDLVYIILSNRTAPTVAQRTYESVKREFPTWNEALNSPVSRLQELLQLAGLAKKKSQQIWATLQQIESDFGSCDLGSLQEKPTAEIQEYLVSLPGVSEKVAKCVMMYTMEADVLPVDTHIHRISKRLGWTARKRLDQCHDELEALIPPERRFAFHVDCILHGRMVCRPRNPSCDRCCIKDHCSYFGSIDSE